MVRFHLGLLILALGLFASVGLRANPLGEATMEIHKRRFDRALGHLEAAVAANLDVNTARTWMGYCLAILGRNDEARSQLRQVLRAQANPTAAYLLFAAKFDAESAQWLSRMHQARPDSIAVRTYLAYVLATSPDASLRDGRRAVALVATAATEPTAEFGLLQAYAAGLAEIGRWEEAIAVQRRAMNASKAESASEFRERRTLRRQLKSYLERKAWHQHPDL